MTELLQHAYETVSRLAPAAQDHIAEAMLALAGEEAAGFEFTLPGGAPNGGGNLRTDRHREALSHPDGATLCADSMEATLAEAHNRSSGSGRG